MKRDEEGKITYISFLGKQGLSPELNVAVVGLILHDIKEKLSPNVKKVVYLDEITEEARKLAREYEIELRPKTEVLIP